MWAIALNLSQCLGNSFHSCISVNEGMQLWPLTARLSYLTSDIFKHLFNDRIFKAFGTLP